MTVYELNEVLRYLSSLQMLLEALDELDTMPTEIHLLKVSLASRVDPQHLRESFKLLAEEAE